MDNQKISQFLIEIADLLDIKGDNPFRIRSYRNGARTVRDLTENLVSIVRGKDEDLTQIPGIGASLAGKIREIVETGNLKFLDDLKKQLPPGLPEILKIEGIGPKKAKLFYEEAGVDSVESLDEAAESGKLHDLFRIGDKTEKKILRAIKNYQKGVGRFRIDRGFTYAQSITDYLDSVPNLTELLPAGSLRRRRETIGDIDILAVSGKPTTLMDRFVDYDRAAEILAQGTTKSSIRLQDGLQVDLRVMKPREFGSALLYFTGSKAHNIALRKRAREMGMKLSEYGVFREDKAIAGQTEDECYRALELPWIPPELRENRGEIEAAAEGKLPRLIELNDIRGDCHMHTTASDGKNSIEEMARTAKDIGYSYIAITEHSKAVRIAGGLNEKELAEHLLRIEEANSKIKGIRILKGIEVDIMGDGTLDLKDEILKKCDVVIASIHSRFNLPEKEMTKRIIRGIKNRQVNILGHPTGRLLLEREPYRVDMEEVIKVAAGEGVVLEINSHPRRLDLNDIHTRMAKDRGARLIINTDAHSIKHLELMKYGIFTARRGWLEKEDVINTYPLKKLLAFFK
ncbi:MAG: DNA polymerase/3'-5' exonuclease PolX [Candidatus Auribacterota bacterium]|nr:DNA polymerase/3'-5' exonuclease PolX [Candidatus Auribacterota bacterium]